MSAAISSSRILDLLAAGVAHVRVYGVSSLRTWFCLNVSAAERLAFDLFLVKSKDELAWRPGTTEYRFVERCCRMADALPARTEGSTP